MIRAAGRDTITMTCFYGITERGNNLMTKDPIQTALRMIPYGFYAISSRAGDDTNVMVLNWFSQVSFEPRLVMIGLSKTAHSYGLIREGGAFVVNVFHRESAEALKPFTKSRAKNPDKMAAARFTPSATLGLPVLEGAAAYLECRVRQFVDVGADHDVVVAEVIGAGVMSEHDPAETLTLPDLGWSYAG